MTNEKVYILSAGAGYEGVSVFRCLSCIYIGYGFHMDPDIDKQVYLYCIKGNQINVQLGIPKEISLNDTNNQ